MTQSLIDQAITACQETLETIKQQEEFNKFLLHEHKCPTCGKKITKRSEYEFTNSVGECMQCDHVRNDLDPEERTDMDDIKDMFGDYDEGGEFYSWK